jgi:hypothetical protein
LGYRQGKTLLAKYNILLGDSKKHKVVYEAWFQCRFHDPLCLLVYRCTGWWSIGT